MISAILLATSAAFASAPAIPPEKWIVNWGESRCSLVRSTGGAKPLILTLRTAMNARYPELLIHNEGWRTDPLDGRDEIDVTLSPGRTITNAEARSFEPISDGSRLIYLTELGDDFMKIFAGSATLIAATETGELARFTYKDAAQAIQALDTCNRDLLKSWGADPAELEKLSRQPEAIGDKSDWLSPNHYPNAAARSGTGADIVIRMTIDENGRVSQCVPVVSSGQATFVRVTCRSIQKKARFKPGLDANGKPVRVNLIEAIHWRIHG